MFDNIMFAKILNEMTSDGNIANVEKKDENLDKNGTYHGYALLDL